MNISYDYYLGYLEMFEHAFIFDIETHYRRQETRVKS
jgi:hypothetical protein